MGDVPKYANEAWVDELAHRVPKTVPLERWPYILAHCKDKTVLDFGCAGKNPAYPAPLGAEIQKVAKEYYGVDKTPCDTIKNFIQMDIETGDWDKIPDNDFEIVVCGEILEHLNNPGFFLDNLKRFNCPIIFTVPSVFNEHRRSWMKVGIELVNSDHVAYYSYYTFCNLVERYGYGIYEYFLWKPFEGYEFYSSGLMFLIEKLK